MDVLPATDETPPHRDKKPETLLTVDADLGTTPPERLALEDDSGNVTETKSQ